MLELHSEYGTKTLELLDGYSASLVLVYSVKPHQCTVLQQVITPAGALISKSFRDSVLSEQTGAQTNGLYLTIQGMLAFSFGYS